MNEQDSQDALDFFMSSEEAERETLTGMAENLLLLVEEGEKLKAGTSKAFWEECRQRAINLNQN